MRLMRKNIKNFDFFFMINFDMKMPKSINAK